MHIMIFLSFFWGVVSCSPPKVEQAEILIFVSADGESQEIYVQAGSTAREALEAAGIVIEILDRSEPPLFTVLTEGGSVHLVRVKEEFEIEEIIVPYETQILHNESIAEGEQRLIQPGVNGLKEITTRRVFEDGVEISTSPVKTVMVIEAVPEVLMVGSQTPFSIIPISGRLAYMSAGNAWIMEENTGNRRPIVTSGDLDGRIFSLSPDGSWLLFTRTEEDEEIINSLWVARIDDDSGLIIDLSTINVVHFADWLSSSTNGVIFSSAESSPSPPGWEANNDLKYINFSTNGWVSRARTRVEGSTGGVYGWWGTDFAWSPSGDRLAYVRPDSVGLVDLEEEIITTLLEITPLQTHGEWAWMPGVAWSPDNKFLYTVDHAAQEGAPSAEESQQFDLTVIPLEGGAPVRIARDVGMFAYPVPSPAISLDSGEEYYLLAFLQAINPTESIDSGLRLVVMDRDGSNQRVLFPPEGAAGINPQRLGWSPFAGEDNPRFFITLIYEGNLWLVDAEDGQSQQLTGDGLTSVIDWK
jgi:hypothetical protein